MGYDAWLGSPPVSDSVKREIYRDLPETVTVLNATATAASAKSELMRGVRSMLATELKSIAAPDAAGIVLGTSDTLDKFAHKLRIPRTNESLAQEEFHIKSVTVDGKPRILIVGGGERGLLYGTFAFLRLLALHRPIDRLDIRERPYAPIRILN